jgi:ribonuclease-3
VRRVRGSHGPRGLSAPPAADPAEPGAGGAAAPGDLASLLGALAVDGLDEALLVRALTHRSWAFEHDPGMHNERLEFLGDAVLDLVITEELYRLLPDAEEGELSPPRAALVRESSLADVARELGLGDHLRLGRGEGSSGGAAKPSLLSDALEAVIAAVHLSAGAEASAALVRRLFAGRIAEVIAADSALDAKTRLQERMAALGRGAPDYDVEGEGPDHERTFHAVVRVDDEALGAGTGRTKKAAEQEAAERALERLDDAGTGANADPGA